MLLPRRARGQRQPLCQGAGACSIPSKDQYLPPAGPLLGREGLRRRGRLCLQQGGRLLQVTMVVKVVHRGKRMVVMVNLKMLPVMLVLTKRQV